MQKGETHSVDRWDIRRHHLLQRAREHPEADPRGPLRFSRNRSRDHRENDGTYARAVSRFISQALAAEDITVFGDGKQTRSFCYITDTITGILTVAADSRARGEVFNIGNPQEITIMDLAQKVRELAGSTSRIVHRPLPPDDPQRRCPDISKAKKLLGWSPTAALEEGLEKTIDWFKQRRQEVA